MQSEPICVLQIVSSLNASSGVLAVVMNWHRNIDTTKVQFDYLYTIDTPVKNKEEIEQLGGRYYKLPHPYKHPVKFLQASYHFFQTHAAQWSTTQDYKELLQ